MAESPIPSHQDLSQLLGVLLNGVLTAAAADGAKKDNSGGGCDHQLQLNPFSPTFCPHEYYRRQSTPLFPLLNSDWIAVSALLCGCPLCNRFLVDISLISNGSQFQKLITPFQLSQPQPGAPMAAPAPALNCSSSSMMFDEGKLSFGLSHLLNAQQLGRITLRTMLLLLEIARQKAHQKAETEPAGSQRLLLPSQQQAASRVVPLLPAPKPEMKVVTATAPTTTALPGNGKSSPFAATTKKRRLSRRQLAAFSATHIDTVEIVTRVKALLVDRAIGQRLFGAAVLGLSQGSVSQLLADPKPWEALNFGREPYIRMVRWLEALPRSMDLLQEMKAVKLLAKMKKVEEEEEKELFQPKWVLGNSPAEASAYFWSHFEEFEDFGAEEEEEENQGEKVGGDDQEVKVEDNKEKKKGVQSPPSKPSCPRPRRRRHHFSREQLTTLRDHFRLEPHPRPLEMQKIAERLGLKYRHIDAWFHNNRVRGSRAVFALSPVSTSILTSTSPSASASVFGKSPATELVGADHEASSTEFGSFNSSSSPSSSSVSSNSYSNFAFSNY